MDECRWTSFSLREPARYAMRAQASGHVVLSAEKKALGSHPNHRLKSDLQHPLSLRGTIFDIAGVAKTFLQPS